MLVDAIENGLVRRVVEYSVMAFFIYKFILSVKYHEVLSPFQFFCMHLDGICSWSKENGINLILVKEPFLLNHDAWSAAPQHPGTNRHAGEVLKRYAAEYAPTAVYVHIPFYDDAEFSKKHDVNRYFLDRGHLTEEGYFIEAGTIADAVRHIKIRRQISRHSSGRR
jgi:hypothetical protein